MNVTLGIGGYFFYTASALADCMAMVSVRDIDLQRYTVCLKRQELERTYSQNILDGTTLEDMKSSSAFYNWLKLK